MSRRTVYTIAKSLFLYHDCSPGIAVRAAYAYLHLEPMPPFSVSFAQMVSRLEQVMWIPVLSPAEAEDILRTFRLVEAGGV